MQAAVIPIMQVDNPAEYAERVVHPKVTVQRALRDDPLGNMHQRRQVSESQYAAGRQFRRRRKPSPSVMSAPSIRHRSRWTDRRPSA